MARAVPSSATTTASACATTRRRSRGMPRTRRAAAARTICRSPAATACSIVSRPSETAPENAGASEFRLAGKLAAGCGEIHPGVLAFAPDGVLGRTEAGVGEVADGDADRIGVELGVPIDHAAAGRAEMAVEAAAAFGTAAVEAALSGDRPYGGAGEIGGHAEHAAGRLLTFPAAAGAEIARLSRDRDRQLAAGADGLALVHRSANGRQMSVSHCSGGSVRGLLRYSSKMGRSAHCSPLFGSHSR